MSITSKSPKRVLQVAHQIGCLRLRRYSHRFSPQKFTLPQLFACLVLKEFLRLDYRKLSGLLHDAPTLAGTIGLTKIPHFTTFQKAASRLLTSRRAQLLLDETVSTAIHHGVMRRRVALAAIDGTGFETRHISAYFVRRRQRACKTGYQTTTYTRYPTANLVCDCASHMVLGVVTGRGPGPDDPYFQPAVRQATRRSPVGTLVADAGTTASRPIDLPATSAVRGHSSRPLADDPPRSDSAATGGTACEHVSITKNTGNVGKPRPSTV